jgi:hypothetical protein
MAAEPRIAADENCGSRGISPSELRKLRSSALVEGFGFVGVLGSVLGDLGISGGMGWGGDLEGGINGA